MSEPSHDRRPLYLVARQTLNIPTAYEDPRFNSEVDKVSSDGHLSAPLADPIHPPPRSTCFRHLPTHLTDGPLRQKTGFRTRCILCMPIRSVENVRTLLQHGQTEIAGPNSDWKWQCKCQEEG